MPLTRKWIGHRISDPHKRPSTGQQEAGCAQGSCLHQVEGPTTDQQIPVLPDSSAGESSQYVWRSIARVLPHGGSTDERLKGSRCMPGKAQEKFEQAWASVEFTSEHAPDAVPSPDYF